MQIILSCSCDLNSFFSVTFLHNLNGLSIELINTIKSLLPNTKAGMKKQFILITRICLQLFVRFTFCNIRACCHGIASNKQILLLNSLVPSPLHPLPELSPEPWLPISVKHTASCCKCTHLVYSAFALLFPEQKVTAQKL